MISVFTLLAKIQKIPKQNPVSIFFWKYYHDLYSSSIVEEPIITYAIYMLCPLTGVRDI
jgi:hypothetical protein